MNIQPTIAITGSSGFIGSRLVKYFVNLGYNVRALQRKPLAQTLDRVVHVPFDLSNVTDHGIAGADYLIHCAYQPAVGSHRGTSANVDGTRQLIAHCRAHSVRIIFLSTLSAHPRAESQYGKEKLYLESLFTAPTDLVLKLGFILGEGGGLFGRITSILATKKIVPLVGGNKHIQTLALTDLCHIIKHALEKKRTGTLLCAHPQPITIKNLYAAIAETMHGHPLLIPVPIALAFTCCRSAEQLGLRIPITSENVLGLKRLEVFNTTRDMQSTGLTLQDYRTALQTLRRTPLINNN